MNINLTSSSKKQGNLKNSLPSSTIDGNAASVLKSATTADVVDQANHRLIIDEFFNFNSHHKSELTIKS